MRLRSSFFSTGVLCLCTFAFMPPALPADPELVYLGDNPGLIVSSVQSWGDLGLNTAAHQPNLSGLPLQIGSKTYAKGLGHHANGSLSILLDGRYNTFNAEVGLQPCSSGSVIFTIMVDGVVTFDSGVMRSGDPAKVVEVSLKGASEMALVASDAGDGIGCDMANWAEARLTTAPRLDRAFVASHALDVAPFARVVSWDPDRTDGSRASRIEEFRAEDIYTETDLKRWHKGYTVPVNRDGQGCIGLQWLNRRALKHLSLEFAATASVPAVRDVRLQAWFGESAWQGEWKSLSGEVTSQGNRVDFQISFKQGLAQTYKIRWIFPSTPDAVVSRLSAVSRFPSTNVVFHLFAEPGRSRGTAELQLDNAEFTGPALSAWRMQKPLPVSLRITRPGATKCDPAALLFRTGSTVRAVAVEDVLCNPGVYLPDLGVLVTTNKDGAFLEAYKDSIKGRTTVLEQVRNLPDQTFSQAMSKTHRDVQREGPVMLSLACDNQKFVVEKDGTVRFQDLAQAGDDWMGAAARLRASLGPATAPHRERKLVQGWLPVPVIISSNAGLVLRQTTFVAPIDEPARDPARLNRSSACFLRFSISNSLPHAVDSSFSLSFAPSPRSRFHVQPALDATFSLGENGVSAAVDVSAVGTLTPSVKELELRFCGALEGWGSAQVIVVIANAGTNLLPLARRSDEFLSQTADYWNAVFAHSLQVETPDTFLNEVIRSSEVRCLIAARNEAQGQRVAPWIAAMSYGPLESEANSVIRGMDYFGHTRFAERGLDFFFHRYNTNGFLTTGYTTFGTAWHLWTAAEHFDLTHDVDWARRNAPVMLRSGEWILRQLDKTRRSGAPGSGLMPPGVMADWNAFAYHYALNAYYYAGLRQMGEVLLQVGDSGQRETARRFLARAEDFRADILRAYRWTQSRSPVLPLANGRWVPAYPSQVHSPGPLAHFFPGQDAGRSWCYDVELGAHQAAVTGVLDPRSSEVALMLDHMEDVQFLSDGWFDYPASENRKDVFNLGGFSKVQPYYTRNAEIYALRDDIKPFVRSYFNTLAAMLNPEVLTIWEHFRHSGAWDKTHETGYFLHQTRTMLLCERGAELWIAPLVTSNWLAQGNSLRVANAPTRFGPLCYAITSRADEGRIDVTVQPLKHRELKRIVVRLRHPGEQPIQGVTVNGKPHRDFDSRAGLIRLRPGDSAHVVRVDYGC